MIGFFTTKQKPARVLDLTAMLVTVNWHSRTFIVVCARGSVILQSLVCVHIEYLITVGAILFRQILSDFFNFISFLLMSLIHSFIQSDRVIVFRFNLHLYLVHDGKIFLLEPNQKYALHVSSLTFICYPGAAFWKQVDHFQHSHLPSYYLL